jgi:mono/diheme cytochrome c family protein
MYPSCTPPLPTIFLVAAILSVASAFTAAATPSPDAIELGRHLVEDIGMCADCHSPRTADGSFDRARWLAGAPLGFTPTLEMPWAPATPALAGLPTFSDEHVIRLLTTGSRPDGSRPLPPMPTYRFTADEAAAVVAYLRSIVTAP